MGYLDFDLVIEGRGDELMARVANSPLGRAHAPLVHTLDAARVDAFIRAMGHQRDPASRRALPARDDASFYHHDPRRFGGSLFESVFTGDVGRLFERNLENARHRDQGLRIRLQLDTSSALSDVPWEFLYSEREGTFLALSVSTPVVRFIELNQGSRPLAVQPPLNVLVVVPSPQGVRELDSADELSRLGQATVQLRADGLVHLSLVENATFDSVRDELGRRARAGHEVHVLHFIGHGSFDPQSGSGSLVFENAHRLIRLVSGHDLGMILHDHPTVRLVVLNACEGARSNRADPLGGVAQALVRQGIPAVVAMQFEVTDESARIFAGEFYAALAEGRPVDSATGEARRAIFTSDNMVEWATPVLYLTSSDATLFEFAERTQRPPVDLATPAVAGEGQSAQGRAGVHDAPRPVVGTPVSRAQDFFGRYREVRRLLDKLRTPPLQNAAIVGPKRAGKTSLLRHLQTLSSTTTNELRTLQRSYVLDGFDRHRWVYVDFQSPRLQTRAGFFRHTLHQLTGANVGEDVGLDSFYEEMQSQLSHPTVILLDEVGVVINRLFREYDDTFWDAMRSLASSDAGRNLAFVLSTHEPPHALATAAAYTSPFFNIIGYTATLGPLTDDEADELIHALTSDRSEEEGAWIKQQSGRWPLLLEILCADLANAVEEREPSTEWRSRVLDQLAPHAHLLEARPGP